MRRISTIALTLALLALASTLHAAPAAPALLRVAWSSDTRLIATLSWTQTSDASQVCVEKRDAGGAYTLIGCGPAHVGESFAVRLPPAAPHDAALVPHVGDGYTLVEFFGTDQTSYAPAALGPRTVLLPLVAR